jgi:glycosyltransferase involved in cell wall biosynthesis
VTFHDVIAETLPHLVFENRRSRHLWNLKSRLALRRSSGVVTVSEASKTGLMDVYGVPPERIHVIPEAPSDVFRPVGPGSQDHHEILNRYGLSGGDRFFLYVGGISPHKNVETLIRAFAVAADTIPSDHRLVLVGDYEGDVFRTCHASLVQLAAALGVADRVLFPGFVPDEDLAHLYSVALAFVFPSFLEGFGLPAVEAMACGAPVVTSDRGSLPEVVGSAGPLFDPHDHNALARILGRLSGDVQYQQELHQRSLDRARAFRWEHSAKRVMEIFRKYVQ